MPNAAGECNACEGFETTQNSLISQPKPVDEPEFRLFGVGIRRFCGKRSGPALQTSPQRFAPFGKPAAQDGTDFRAPGRFAIECRPPFDKDTPAVDNRRNAQGGLEIGHRQREGAAKFTGLGALDIREGQKALADPAALV